MEFDKVIALGSRRVTVEMSTYDNHTGYRYIHLIEPLDK